MFAVLNAQTESYAIAGLVVAHIHPVMEAVYLHVPATVAQEQIKAALCFFDELRGHTHHGELHLGLASG